MSLHDDSFNRTLGDAAAKAVHSLENVKGAILAKAKSCGLEFTLAQMEVWMEPIRPERTRKAFSEMFGHSLERTTDRWPYLYRAKP